MLFMSFNKIVFVLSLLVLASCDDVFDGIGEVIGDAIVCSADNALTDNGVSLMGTEEAMYNLNSDSSVEPPPLMNGTQGAIRLLDFAHTGDKLEVTLSEPAVLEVGHFEADDEMCGVVGTWSAIGSGTTGITILDPENRDFSWDIEVKEPVELGFSSFWLDPVSDDGTLDLLLADWQDPVDLTVEVYDAEGEMLSYLEPATWEVTEGQSIVSIGHMIEVEEDDGGWRSEFQEETAPIDGTIMLDLKTAGNATLTVRIGDALQGTLNLNIE